MSFFPCSRLFVMNDKQICYLQDLHMISLEDFKYGGTNVTAFRLVDPDREEVRQVSVNFFSQFNR